MKQNNKIKQRAFADNIISLLISFVFSLLFLDIAGYLLSYKTANFGNPAYRVDVGLGPLYDVVLFSIIVSKFLSLIIGILLSLRKRYVSSYINYKSFYLVSFSFGVFPTFVVLSTTPFVVLTFFPLVLVDTIYVFKLLRVLDARSSENARHLGLNYLLFSFGLIVGIGLHFLTYLYVIG